MAGALAAVLEALRHTSKANDRSLISQPLRCPMTTASHISPSSNHQTLAGILARGAQIGIGLVIEAAILFLVSGRLDWAWAWIFLGLYLVSITVNTVFML